MAQVPRVRRPDKSKYTILVDRHFQDYQLHIKRHTNVNFADLVRAAINKVASDPDLERELIVSIGGGYYDDGDSDHELNEADLSDPSPVAEPPAQPVTDPGDQDGDFWPGEA